MVAYTLNKMTIAAAVCGWLYNLQRHHASFSLRVFAGMGLGIVLGTALHLI